MNSRERVHVAMSGGNPDCVPVIPQICPPHAIRAADLPFKETIVDRLRDPEPYDLLVADCAQTYGVDGFRVWAGGTPQTIEWRGDEAMAVDPQTGETIGRVDFEGGGGVLVLPEKQRALTETDLEAIRIPDARTLAAGPILRPLRKAVAKYGDTRFLIGVPGQFTLETLCHVQGMQQTLMDIIERPAFIRRWTEHHLQRSIRIATAMATEGAEALYIGETFGQFLSPDDFRALCLPYFQEFVRALRPTGVLVYLHMCGRIGHLLDLIADTGVDCIEPLDELGGTRVAEVKQHLGRRMALMGGVRTDLLAHGSLADVEADIRRCIAEAAAGGGFILAAGDMLPTETDPAKVHAMVHIAHSF